MDPKGDGWVGGIHEQMLLYYTLHCQKQEGRSPDCSIVGEQTVCMQGEDSAGGNKTEVVQALQQTLDGLQVDSNPHFFFHFGNLQSDVNSTMQVSQR